MIPAFIASSRESSSEETIVLRLEEETVRLVLGRAKCLTYVISGEFSETNGPKPVSFPGLDCCCVQKAHQDGPGEMRFGCHLVDMQALAEFSVYIHASVHFSFLKKCSLLVVPSICMHTRYSTDCSVRTNI